MMTALLMCAFISTPLQANTGGDPVSTTTTAANAAAANTLTTRLQEIKDIDRTNMSSTEKRELRKETRAIKSQLRAISGGVYISAGAVILVALLLILLL